LCNVFHSRDPHDRARERITLDVDGARGHPSRTGSIVITFGDAIVPRGGSVWLGTLLEFFGTIDMERGVARTARAPQG
jgi:hypothetical protein